jgi:hypothetical protein
MLLVLCALGVTIIIADEIKRSVSLISDAPLCGAIVYPARELHLPQGVSRQRTRPPVPERAPRQTIRQASLRRRTLFQQIEIRCR